MSSFDLALMLLSIMLVLHPRGRLGAGRLLQLLLLLPSCNSLANRRVVTDDFQHFLLSFYWKGRLSLSSGGTTGDAFGLFRSSGLAVVAEK